MGIKIVMMASYAFDEEKGTWTAEVSPRIEQSFPDYFICDNTECEHKALNLSETADNLNRDRFCVYCTEPVKPKEDAFIALGKTEYEAVSIAEVNSAIETNMLILQRQCEEQGENLRQAEEDAKPETIPIKRVSTEEEADASAEPEAG